MNNKKLIIIIAAAVAAIAAIIVAIVLIGGAISGQRPDEPDTSSASSITSGSSQDSNDTSSGSGTSSGSSTNTSSATSSVIEEGKVGIGKVEGSTGKTVEVPITISKNPGIVAGQFFFEYDSSVLTYVDYEKGNILDEYDINDLGGQLNCVIMASDVSKDVTKNGDIIVLRFKIKDNAKKGDYTVKLGAKSMICNKDEVVVTPNITDGKITVN